MGLAWPLAAAGLAVAFAAAAFAWHYRSEFSSASRQSARLRLENDKMRQGFGQIAGWSPEGRLPEDWPNIIREKLRPAAPVVEATFAQKTAGCDSLLGAAREVLTSVSSPVLAAGDRPEQANEVHSRTIELLERLEREPKPLLPALANGDLDRLFGYWGRLDVYFPEADQTVPYMLAASVFMIRLKSEGIYIRVPRPLSVVDRAEADFTTEDMEGLRRNNVVRGLAAAVRFSPASGGERLVVDCISPGWSGPAGGKRPRVLIWDRSWQD
jgi:hypothetical protein